MLELEQKLGLYQVFLNLYENDRGLLNEILQLENGSDRAFTRSRGKYKYIMGVVEAQSVYLIANLTGVQSQKIFQPQNIWTIGRGQKVGISIPDDRLSRHHAAIQYIADRGFYLHDLNSTNGTYVNQEPVCDRILLQAGDRIRLGSVVFEFCFCQGTRQLAHVPKNIVSNLNQKDQASLSSEPVEPSERKTSFFLEEEKPSAFAGKEESPELKPTQKSQLLDRFFHQQRHRR
ncbi:MAG: FHA domain-containing protein [Spirulina sp.]